MHGKDRSAVIGFIVFVCVAIAVWIAMINWLSSDNRDTTDGNETIESPEAAPEYPPQTEATTSSEFDVFLPEVTRVGVVPNDVAVYVFCDGPNRVYVMNTVSTTKELEIARDFPGCRGERMAGEVIHG